MSYDNFTHQIMKAIQQTDEWDRVWKEDPKLQEAKVQLDAAMEQIGSQISAELRDSLWASIYGLNAASEAAAILYGIRVAAAIRDAAAIDRTKPVMQRGTGEMDEAIDTKLWEIRRYIDSAKVQSTVKSLPTSKELLALGQFAGNGLYDAILLAFAYGRAKGWLAAREEVVV